MQGSNQESRIKLGSDLPSDRARVWAKISSRIWDIIYGGMYSNPKNKMKPLKQANLPKQPEQNKQTETAKTIKNEITT